MLTTGKPKYLITGGSLLLSSLTRTTVACLATQQQRLLSALPQVSDDLDDLTSQAAIPEHNRRLQEMQDASCKTVRGSSTQNVRWAKSFPTQEEVAMRLRGSGSCSTSSAQVEEVNEDLGLDWRQAVAAARRTGQSISGDDMLTDTFRRKHTYLRISLTERCNLRCLYCMPEEGVDLTPKQRLMTTEEVYRVAKLFVSSGVDKIRLTGGEPTVRPDLMEMTARLSSLPGLKALGMTTNGLALEPKLEQLQRNGVSLLNISLDTLQPERWEYMTRRKGHHRVLRSIEKALALGYAPLKLNVVVMKGTNDDEIGDFVELTRSEPLNVRFIEYMPFDGNVWSHNKLLSYADMRKIVLDRFPQGLVSCQDPRGEVAKNFRVPGFKGSVSFITSMTKAFCGDCNRLRIMADGNIKVCLFGANEVSLRDAMREGATDDDLRAVISAAVDRKRAAHAGMFELAKSKNRAMIKIGG